MTVSLPPLGRLGTFWRPVMRAAPPVDGDLIVDMRSGPYASAWKAPQPAVAVRVFRERLVDGVPRRTVVSHMAKATRGKVAHDLLKAGSVPRTPEELLKAVADLGHTAELNGTDLDIVLQD